MHEYPVELPAFTSAQAVGQVWLDHLKQFKAVSALPEAMLAQLLERCEIMAQTSLKQGVKLVRAVEAFFPDQAELLEPVAAHVIPLAYRSSAGLQEARKQEIEQIIDDLADDYEAASPEQQVAVSMLAVQELLSALTLSVSEQEPHLVREWITAHGLLKLEALYQTNRLLIEAALPSGGRLQLLGGESEAQATRPDAGQLSLVQSAPKAGQTYTLEVFLSQSGQRPLRFALSVVKDSRRTRTASFLS
ncbi:MAG: hypothetical protein F6J97_26450 [Leptolyngbya sp. SIO4C1]|nr:hypothetical protein [Leptolyngbya sp. SIO4C1]